MTIEFIPPAFQPVMVLAHEGLFQVFINLITNACEAMSSLAEGQPRVLNVKIYTDKKYAIAELSDTGPGMNEKTRVNIFKPFAATTKDFGKGTGLGMGIAYNFIRDHEGSIEVKSEVGTGTQFRITLPLYRGEPVPEEPVEEPTERVKAKTPILISTILIVDDDETQRIAWGNETDKLAVELAKESIALKTFIAVSPGEALRFIEGNRDIEVMFTDMSMLGEEEAGLLLALQARAKGFMGPIAVYSGYGPKDPRILRLIAERIVNLAIDKEGALSAGKIRGYLETLGSLSQAVPESNIIKAYLARIDQGEKDIFRVEGAVAQSFRLSEDENWHDLKNIVARIIGYPELCQHKAQEKTIGELNKVYGELIKLSWLLSNREDAIIQIEQAMKRFGQFISICAQIIPWLEAKLKGQIDDKERREADAMFRATKDLNTYAQKFLTEAGIKLASWQKEGSDKSSSPVGVKVPVLVNLANWRDAKRINGLGVVGIGLYRTEHEYAGRKTPITEIGWVRRLTYILKTAKVKYLRVRIIDRKLTSRGKDALNAPVFGRSRLEGLEYILCDRKGRKIAITQLKAAFRVYAKYGEIAVTLPMLSNYADRGKVSELIGDAKYALTDDKVVTEDDLAGFERGLMFETPQSMNECDQLIHSSDFGIVGSNDLIALSEGLCRWTRGIAVDRLKEITPTTFQQLNHLLDERGRINPGYPLSLAGALASTPEFLLLAGYLAVKGKVIMPSVGIDEVAYVKEFIRRINARRVTKIFDKQELVSDWARLKSALSPEVQRIEQGIRLAAASSPVQIRSAHNSIGSSPIGNEETSPSPLSQAVLGVFQGLDGKAVPLAEGTDMLTKYKIIFSQDILRLAQATLVRTNDAEVDRLRGALSQELSPGRWILFFESTGSQKVIPGAYVYGDIDGLRNIEVKFADFLLLPEKGIFKLLAKAIGSGLRRVGKSFKTTLDIRAPFVELDSLITLIDNFIPEKGYSKDKTAQRLLRLRRDLGGVHYQEWQLRWYERGFRLTPLSRREIMREKIEKLINILGPDRITNIAEETIKKTRLGKMYAALGLVGLRLEITEEQGHSGLYLVARTLLNESVKPAAQEPSSGDPDVTKALLQDALTMMALVSHASSATRRGGSSPVENNLGDVLRFGALVGGLSSEQRQVNRSAVMLWPDLIRGPPSGYAAIDPRIVIAGFMVYALGLYLASKPKVPFLKYIGLTTLGVGWLSFQLSAGALLLSAIAALSHFILASLIRPYVSGQLRDVAYSILTLIKSLVEGENKGGGIFYIIPPAEVASLSPSNSLRKVLSSKGVSNLLEGISINETSAQIEYRLRSLPFQLITLSIGIDTTNPCAYLVLYPNLKGDLRLSYAINHEAALGEKRSAIKKLLDKIIGQIRDDFLVAKPRECPFEPDWVEYITLYPRMLIGYQVFRAQGKDRTSAWREIFAQAMNEYPELTPEALEEMLIGVFSLMPEERLLKKAGEFVGQVNREEWTLSQIRERRAVLRALACELAADSIDDYVKVMEIVREEFGDSLVSISRDVNKCQAFYERLSKNGLGEWVLSPADRGGALRLSVINNLEEIFLRLPERIPGAGSKKTNSTAGLERGRSSGSSPLATGGERSPERSEVASPNSNAGLEQVRSSSPVEEARVSPKTTDLQVVRRLRVEEISDYLTVSKWVRRFAWSLKVSLISAMSACIFLAVISNEVTLSNVRAWLLAIPSIFSLNFSSNAFSPSPNALNWLFKSSTSTATSLAVIVVVSLMALFFIGVILKQTDNFVKNLFDQAKKAKKGDGSNFGGPSRSSPVRDRLHTGRIILQELVSAWVRNEVGLLGLHVDRGILEDGELATAIAILAQFLRDNKLALMANRLAALYQQRGQPLGDTDAERYLIGMLEEEALGTRSSEPGSSSPVENRTAPNFFSYRSLRQFSALNTLKESPVWRERKWRFSVTRASAPVHSVNAAIKASAGFRPFASYLAPNSKDTSISSSILTDLLIKSRNSLNASGVRLWRTSSAISLVMRKEILFGNSVILSSSI